MPFRNANSRRHRNCAWTRLRRVDRRSQAMLGIAFADAPVQQRNYNLAVQAPKSRPPKTNAMPSGGSPACITAAAASAETTKKRCSGHAHSGSAALIVRDA